ncbi:MAG TPA: 3'-5' exonuclease [Gemmataceae bacterium]|nr:3'-5' exonuclease [Gemmataceae bacterium]
MSTFVAIDFETADRGADSACAVALVRVEGWEVVAKEVRLIRPPRRWIRFAYIHGIEWRHVADQPLFRDVWPQLSPLLDGAKQLVAHNAPFDRGVLQACCDAAGLEMPPVPFLCSCQVARRTWGLRPANLPAVCRFLNISLNHHDPLSDAEAAARIVIAARKAFAAETPR